MTEGSSYVCTLRLFLDPALFLDYQNLECPHSFGLIYPVLPPTLLSCLGSGPIPPESGPGGLSVLLLSFVSVKATAVPVPEITDR